SLSIIFSLLVISVRYLLLPLLDDSTGYINKVLSNAVGQEVSVGKIKARWMGYRPELSLAQVKILDNENNAVLELDQVNAVISGSSLINRQLIFHSLEIFNPTLSAKRDAEGLIWIAGSPVSGLGKGVGYKLRKWLVEQRQILIRDAVINWSDETVNRPDVMIQDANLRIDNQAGTHKISMSGNPSEQMASSLIFRAVFDSASDYRFILGDGRFFLDLRSVKIGNPVATGSFAHFEGHTIEAGYGDIRLWGILSENKVSEISAELSLSNLVFESIKNSNQVLFEKLTGLFKWRSDLQGRRITGRDVFFKIAGRQNELPVNFNFSTFGDEEYKLEIDLLNLGTVSGLFNQISLRPFFSRKPDFNQISGFILNTNVRWVGHSKEPRLNELHTQFNNLGFVNSNLTAGLKGLDGRLNFIKKRGVFSIDSSDVSLYDQRLLLHRLTFEKIRADLIWENYEDKLKLSISEGSYSNGHMMGRMQADFDEADESFEVKLHVDKMEASHLWKYLPSKAPKTSKWIEKSIKSGSLSDVTLVWTAPVESLISRKLPNLDHLVGTGYMSDVKLDYARNWPTINNLGGELKISNRRISMTVDSGHVHGINIRGSKARVHKLGTKKEYLFLLGRGTGPVNGFREFILNSPLAKKNTELINKIRADGVGHVGFEYELPFREKNRRKISGDYQAAGSFWSLDETFPKLESYKQTLFFDTLGIISGQGNGTIFGETLNYSIGRNKANEVFVDLDGGVNFNKFTFPNKFLTSFFHGKSQWNGRLTIASGSNLLKVKSNLYGLGSALPHPFNKEAGASLDTEIFFNRLESGERFLVVKIVNLLAAHISHNRGDTTGKISIGANSQGQKADNGLKVDLKNLDLDSWRDIYEGFKKNLVKVDSNVGFSLGSSLNSLDFKVSSLKWLDRKFNLVHLKADKEGSVWKGSIDSRQGKGFFAWSPKPGKSRINAQFEHLHIPAKSSSKSVKPSSANKEKQLPDLDIVARRFSFKGKAMGTLNLVAESDASKWNLKSLAVKSAAGEIAVQGQTSKKQVKKTELNVAINAFDIGKFLGQLGYAKGVEGGKGQLKGFVGWEGFADKIDFSTLSGQIDVQATNGQFTQLDPGAAKLLGILSLQALPRRLVLDFSDIFSSGFNFEKIDSNFDIKDGVATTDNFSMIGPAAKVKMEGAIDLGSERQRLSVDIFPQLSTAAAVAGAAVVNPAVGVATYVIQKLFGDPVEKMAAKSYLVTGTWSNPSVEKIEAKASEEVK
ncbi:MAG: TIGR02099 family protein, partial [Proteobacteria bacterium]|nr:TIGR02099 family protein [Pseudomonadota bacterium]